MAFYIKNVQTLLHYEFYCSGVGSGTANTALAAPDFTVSLRARSLATLSHAYYFTLGGIVYNYTYMYDVPVNGRSIDHVIAREFEYIPYYRYRRRFFI